MAVPLSGAGHAVEKVLQRIRFKLLLHKVPFRIYSAASQEIQVAQ